MTPGWLELWTGTQAMASAFPLLHHFSVRLDLQQIQTDPVAAASVDAARDVLSFLQWLADRPVHRLSITTGEHVAFNAPAMAELARCQQLQHLFFSAGVTDQRAWMDWTDASVFAPLVASCLPCLSHINLQGVRLSAEAVIAVARSAPQLRTLILIVAEPRCHPAVICAIVAGLL